MRVAIFTDTFLPQINGVTNTLRRFGDYLEEQEISYIFITPEQKVDECLPYSMATFFSTPLLFYPECRLTLPNMLRLNRKLDRFQPDIIFCMTEFTMGLTGLLYGRRRHIPVITNYSTNFGMLLCSYNMQVLEKPLRKYLSWFHGEAQLTVTPSRQSEEVLHEMGVVKTGIFSRGIQIGMYAQGALEVVGEDGYQNREKVRLLYVGRLSPEKDLDILREAMYILNATYEDSIELIVTGDGPMRDELEKTMPKNVQFTGYKKGNELADIYTSADIFAFPSSFETFGNVVLEAYAAELPVVGVSKGGVIDNIIHSSTGYLAKPRDAMSFAAALELLIQDPTRRRTMGEKGRQFAESRTWESVFGQLMEKFIQVKLASSMN